MNKPVAGPFLSLLQFRLVTRWLESRSAPPIMDDDDDAPPMAVEVAGDSPAADGAGNRSVGVTVITGYLGAGKSTVSWGSVDEQFRAVRIQQSPI